MGMVAYVNFAELDIGLTGARAGQHREADMILSRLSGFLNPGLQCVGCTPVWLLEAMCHQGAECVYKCGTGQPGLGGGEVW